MKQFKCETCGKSFQFNAYLKVHIRTHTGERPYACSDCGKTFQTAHGLKRHKLTHTGEKNFKCELCGVRFRLKDQLMTHLRAHTGEKPHKCQVCNKNFGTTTSLKEHQIIHAESRPLFPCERCPGVTFKWKHSLTNHNARKHGKGTFPFQCPLCPKKYATRPGLRAHREIHEAKGKFECGICHNVFGYKRSLERHLNFLHDQGSSSRFLCIFCGKGYGERNVFQRHTLGHINERPYLCKICGNGYISNSILSLHLKTKHGVGMDSSGKGMLSCNICGEKFMFQCRLFSHIKRHHLLEKAHQCEVCGKSFPEGGLLKAHLKIHAPVGTLKLFKCELCGAPLRRVTDLRIHHKHVHLKLKPHVCQTCGKEFARKDKLKQHVDADHLGLKPFRCGTCGKGFGKRASLSNHVGRHRRQNETTS